MPKSSVPTYRLHKASGQAVVVLRGRSVYLGKFNSSESRARYDRVIARYLAERANPDHPDSTRSKRPVPASDRPIGDLLISELILRYWTFAKGYYRKNGKPTGELFPLKQALRLLRQHYGNTPAAEFGPLALKSLQEAMLTIPWIRKVKVADSTTGKVRFEDKVISVGLARQTANKQIGRIKRVLALVR